MRHLALVIVIGVAACSPNQTELWPRPGGEGDRDLPRNRPASTETGMVQKVVHAKEEPATLIAPDRTSCQVTAQKFKEAIIGTKVWCLWR